MAGIFKYKRGMIAVMSRRPSWISVCVLFLRLDHKVCVSYIFMTYSSLVGCMSLRVEGGGVRGRREGRGFAGGRGEGNYC